MLKIKETNVTIMVKNMDRSIEFYQRIGLSLKNRWENHYAQLTGPDIIIGLHPAKATATPSSGMSIGFIVDDLEAAKKLMEENKFTYEGSDDKSGKFLHLTDPDGTLIYFMQPEMSW